MKSTGVLRRIDDLGRIVIPKEIRKNLKIRDGEKLEIYVENSNIILKKYSDATSILDIATKSIDILSGISNNNVLISDRDKIIAASNSLRRKYLDNYITSEFSDIILSRKTYVSSPDDNVHIIENEEDESDFISNPIVTDGDVIGAVILFIDDNNNTELNEKIGSFIAKFLGSQFI